MLGWIVGAVFTFYVAAVPLSAMARWSEGLKTQVRVLGVPIPIKTSGGKPKLSAKKIRIILAMLKHLRVERLSLRGTFSAGDAATTAMLCGAANAARGILRDRAQIALSPDFSRASAGGDVRGMIVLRTGHIILAALSGAVEYEFGRFCKWKDIRSNRS